MRDPRDAQRTQQHADALVRQVLTRDAASPGFALAVALGIANRLTAADRKMLNAPAAGGPDVVDVAALIA